MSVSTKDRAKLGQTTYFASVHTWNDDQSDYLYLWSEECASLDEAKAGVEAALRAANTDPAWGTINEGTYEGYKHQDDKYGTILDAIWERNEHVQWDCYISDGFKCEEQRW